MQIRAWQRAALENHCRLAVETSNPALAHRGSTYSVVLSVNSGYE